MSFYCEGTSNRPSVLRVNNNLLLGLKFGRNIETENHYRSRNFTWRRHEEDSEGNAKLYSWELHVIASPINNLTRVICDYDTNPTNEALLVVVDGKCTFSETLILK